MGASEPFTRNSHHNTVITPSKYCLDEKQLSSAFQSSFFHVYMHDWFIGVPDVVENELSEFIRITDGLFDLGRKLT